MCLPVKENYVSPSLTTRAMFIYVILRDVRRNPTYVDKWICKGECNDCKNRFVCFTEAWKTFRGQDDYGIFVEQDVFDVLPLSDDLAYCCRLVVGKVWDKLANNYVPEV